MNKMSGFSALEEMSAKSIISQCRENVGLVQQGTYALNSYSRATRNQEEFLNHE